MNRETEGVRQGEGWTAIRILVFPLVLLFSQRTLAAQPDSAKVKVDTTGTHRLLIIQEEVPRTLNQNPAPAESLVRAMKRDSTRPDTSQAARSAETWADSIFTRADTLAGDPVKYLAQKIEYDLKQDRILLVGKSRVAYKELRVEADTIEFHVKKDLLVARGKPVLWDSDKWMTGSQMTYSLKTKNGEVLNGRASFERGFYWGEKIRKIGPDQFNVSSGEFTTCSLATPHYWFWSRKMKIFNDDKVIAEPVVMFISGIPCAALPFWVFPIKKGRHSGFLVPRIGSSAYEGKYIKNLSYYEVLGDYADATLGGDLTEKIGWVTSWEGRYIYAPKISSQLSGSYTDGGETRVKQLQINGSHQQSLGPKTNLTGQLDYVSTTQFLEGYTEDRTIRLDRNLRSFASLQHSWSQASGYLVLDQTRNIDQKTVSQLLPQLTLSSSRPLTKWLFSSYNANGVNSVQKDSLQEIRHAGVNQDLSLSSSNKLFGWLSLSPNAAYHETWYDRDVNGVKNVRRGILTWGLSANTTIYGVPKGRVGPFLSLRHIMNPSIGYSVVPPLRQDRFDSSFGYYTPSRSLSLGLRNTLQGKFGDPKNPKRWDLATLDFSDGYNFKAVPGQRWGPLATSAVLLPTNPVTQVRLSMQHDVYRKRLTSLTLQSSYTIGGKGSNVAAAGLPDTTGEGEAESQPALPWNLSLGHTYSRGEDKSLTESQQLWGTIRFYPTKHWRVEYAHRYDLKKKETISQDYTVYRDLHCWEANFVASVSGVQWSYGLKINIKAIPDIKGERKRSGQQ